MRDLKPSLVYLPIFRHRSDFLHARLRICRARALSPEEMCHARANCRRRWPVFPLSCWAGRHMVHRDSDRWTTACSKPAASARPRQCEREREVAPGPERIGWHGSIGPAARNPPSKVPTCRAKTAAQTPPWPPMRARSQAGRKKREPGTQHHEDAGPAARCKPARPPARQPMRGTTLFFEWSLLF